MLRTKHQTLLGRPSGALGVQGKVRLDIPGVVIDRMTNKKVGGFEPEYRRVNPRLLKKTMLDAALEAPLYLVVCRSSNAEALAVRKRRYRQLLVLVLQLVELPVDAAMGQQLLVRADLADLALVHHDDLVGALNGAEAVGDHDRGAAFDHAGQRVAHAEFGFGVDARGGFVEDEDLGIVRQRSGERDELLLAGRQRAAALLHLPRRTRRAASG